jgi:hypothetical protein
MALLMTPCEYAAFNASIDAARQVADANAEMASDEVDVFKLNDPVWRAHRRVALLCGLLNFGLIAKEQIDGVRVRGVEKLTQRVGKNAAGHGVVAVAHNPTQVRSAPLHPRGTAQRSIERHGLFPTVDPKNMQSSFDLAGAANTPELLGPDSLRYRPSNTLSCDADAGIRRPRVFAIMGKDAGPLPILTHAQSSARSALLA